MPTSKTSAKAADETRARPRGRRPGSTNGFARKRKMIIDAATDRINDYGVKGMTFTDVAQAVDLNTTSVTYYFRFKEHLAAAVFEETLHRLETMAEAAGREATPRERVARYLALHFDHRKRVLLGQERAIAILSDMRTLEESARAPLEKHYQAIFRQIRSFFGEPASDQHKLVLTARAHMLTEVVFWLPVWLPHYPIGDFDRVLRRLLDVLDQGIAPAGAPWRPVLCDIGAALDAGEDAGSENFLRVATRLINERGYRGASVDRIVGELNVTKGSFYHHLDAKDDLVLECFRRSYRRVSCAQSLADAAGGSQWQRLASAIATLLDVQFGGEYPLQRTSALQALPIDLRDEVVERSNRIALRFNGTIVDGIKEGSIRAVDPSIASQVIMATLNAATDIAGWAGQMPRAKAVEIYASSLARGIVD